MMARKTLALCPRRFLPSGFLGSVLKVSTACTILVGAAGAQSPLGVAEIAKKTGRAVVLIQGVDKSGASLLGSGFLVAPDGKIVTNLHVIRDLASGGVKLETGEVFDSFSVLAFDERKDLAVIKVAGFDLPVIELGNSNSLTVGEVVVAVGSPRGLEGTVTAGIISAIREDATKQGFRLIQTDAAINPGNSGGPLLNKDAQVIGIVTATFRGSENLNFAVPINYARGLLGSTEPPMTLAEMSARLEKSTDVFSGGTVKRPGVLLAGYGSPGESFQLVFLELMNFLAANGVIVANRPTEIRPVRGDSVSLSYLLERLPKLADSLLYVTVEHGFSNVHRARVQCFNSKGQQVWEEKSSSTWTWATTEQGAAKAVAEQLKRKLKNRIGQPELPLRGKEK